MLKRRSVADFQSIHLLGSFNAVAFGWLAESDSSLCEVEANPVVRTHLYSHAVNAKQRAILWPTKKQRRTRTGRSQSDAGLIENEWLAGWLCVVLCFACRASVQGGTRFGETKIPPLSINSPAREREKCSLQLLQRKKIWIMCS